MARIPYGISSFERIRNKREDFVYVDKTRFIEQLEETSFIIHLRPRRFGKSLFVSMLESYYDVFSTDRFDDLFSGLHIHKNPTMNRNHYYILRFNFSGIATKDFDTMMDGFLNKVKSSVASFISKYQLNIEIKDYGTPAMILNALLEAFNRLNLEHKVYILIDEYDHFTNAVLNNGLEGFMTLVTQGGLVRSFYEVIKEQSELNVVNRLFMTGVMSVSLDSMTSGFNVATNLTTVSTFADMMGFTADEVKQLLQVPKLGSPKEAVGLTEVEQETVYEIFRQNYNGYLFSEESEIKVFNSTLIMYYLKHYVPGKKLLKNIVDPNLNQSSKTISGIVDVKNKEANDAIVEEIVKHKGVSATLSAFIDIDKKFDKNDFITLLFNIGFLTIKEQGMLTKFEIPNKIIEAIYFGYMRELAELRYHYKVDVATQEHALLEMGEQGKINAITHLVSDFLQHTSGRNAIDFRELDIKLTYLKFLFPTNQFFVFDEFPVKHGYTDLTILKSAGSYSKYEFLVELKHVKKGKKEETTKARIAEKFTEGVNQIAAYMKDKRMSGRSHLKKFVVVFVGFEVARIEEIE